MNSPWFILEDVPAHSAAASDWNLLLGEMFHSACETFLQKTKRKASSVQCLYVDGCVHELKPRGDGYVAKCKDDDSVGCDDFLLTADEAEVWEVNLKRLGTGLASALKCRAVDQMLDLDRTRQFASLGSAPLPIMLTVQQDIDSFNDVVARLVAKLPKGFVLLAPTNRFCTATATDLLGRVNAGFFDLENHVNLTRQGTLQVGKPGVELFARFLPKETEPIPEDAARRAFDLIEQLDSEKVIKSPSVFRVFKLYCVKAMTANQVAVECECSKGTVINRLKLIREKTGMKPEALRRFSSHFDKIEDDIRESRASYIHRKRLIDDCEDDYAE